MQFIFPFIFLFIITACQNSEKKSSIETTLKAEVPTTGPSKTISYENMAEWNCDEGSFSYSGDQIIFWCSLPGLLKQKQVFIKDLNSSLVKQVTFLNGRITDPQIVKQDLIVFSSDTDRKKEILTFDTKELENDSMFDLYMYNLKDDVMLQLTNNIEFDGLVSYLKHIDPKIVYLRKGINANQVLIRNLVNNSEKLVYSTTNKILELNTNLSNNILIVEDANGKKSIKLIKSEKEQQTWPDFESHKFNFFYNADSNSLEFLEIKADKTLLKVYNSLEKCEYEIFSFPSKAISHLNKSPIDNQTYVWVEETNGVKKINMGTLKINSGATCKKLSKKGKLRKKIL
jgi:hypothetical protein